MAVLISSLLIMSSLKTENKLDHQFYALYYDYVFVKGYKEYLIETQNENSMAVDLDFRYYWYDTTEKQYTATEKIDDIICLYYGQVGSNKTLFNVTKNIGSNSFYHSSIFSYVCNCI
jgi:hypothetical protein